MLAKILEVIKKIGKSLKIGIFWMGRKIKAGAILLGKSIKTFCHKFVHTWKIPLLIGRFFYGIGYGIYAGVNDAINSWKFETKRIEMYEVHIQSLKFNYEGF